MYIVYILYSKKLSWYNIGYTADLAKRLLEHTTGVSIYTSKANDWVLRYQESFPNREAAHKRELAIKKKKSAKYIEWLINNSGEVLASVFDGSI